MSEEEIKKKVREAYSSIVTQSRGCSPNIFSEDELKRIIKEIYETGDQTSGGKPVLITMGGDTVEDSAVSMGYSKEDLGCIPEGANLGLGCGNPIAYANLNEGETVLDLGSGAGIDCFLAAKKVGERGKVIGVDMTPEMISNARIHAEENGYRNVEFRLGEIEHLPVADGFVDVLISNCVINLVPNKDRVFREAFRVLRPGGRMIVSDIVLDGELPKNFKLKTLGGGNCVDGAIQLDEYLAKVEDAGFKEVKVLGEVSLLQHIGYDLDKDELIKDVKTPDDRLEDRFNVVKSVYVYGKKPL